MVTYSPEKAYAKLAAYKFPLNFFHCKRRWMKKLRALRT